MEDGDFTNLGAALVLYANRKAVSGLEYEAILVSIFVSSSALDRVRP